MKNIILTFLFLFTVLSVNSQKTIHNYKYIVVKDQFSFLKKLDQHQTSSLTKFLFNKNGYTAFLSNEQFPSDLSRNRCLALYVDVNKNSSVFTTKLTIVLKDCNNQVLFTSKEGKSRIKNYKKAYYESIKLAFNSVKALNYKYHLKVPEINVKEVPEVVSIPKSGVIIKKDITKSKQKNDVFEVLFSQPKENGFQLVNDKPEIVFQILKTNKQDFYIIKGKNGILYKNNSVWIAEFYENNKLVTKKYSIKF